VAWPRLAFAFDGGAALGLASRGLAAGGRVGVEPAHRPGLFGGVSFARATDGAGDDLLAFAGWRWTRPRAVGAMVVAPSLGAAVLGGRVRDAGRSAVATALAPGAALSLGSSTLAARLSFDLAVSLVGGREAGRFSASPRAWLGLVWTP
jgi:hypothetical protein